MNTWLSGAMGGTIGFLIGTGVPWIVLRRKIACAKREQI